MGLPGSGRAHEQQTDVHVRGPALEPLLRPRERGSERRLQDVEVVERAFLVPARDSGTAQDALRAVLDAARATDGDDHAIGALADLESGPAARGTGLAHGEGLVSESVAQLR